MPIKNHYNKKTGQNYNYQYRPGNSKPNSPVRDKIYEIYEVGTEVATMDILHALKERFNYTIQLSDLHFCLNEAAKDGEVSRRKISKAGMYGQSTVILWTFLERPVYVEEAPPLGAVQVDRQKASEFLARLKAGNKT